MSATRSPDTSAGGLTPFWSVMIPAYNPQQDYLEQALRSVLAQDPGPEQMQIEVVDDCSPDAGVEAMVKSIAGERIAFSRTSNNLGLAGCWNACIERARGRWVHILHQDDFILQGFYERLARAEQLHPEVSLLATRSFLVDGESVIIRVTDRLRQLENGGRVVEDFLYGTPIQCPGVVVRKSFYQTHGGFRPDLSFVLDREMWARVVSVAGGLVTSDILSCYRTSGGSESERLGRTAEDLRDVERLNRLFAKQYHEFDCKNAIQQLCNRALGQAAYFSRNGDSAAAKANMDYWKKNAPAFLRLRRFAGKVAEAFWGNHA